MDHSSSEKIDVMLAAALIASPAWASWLGSLNQLLTSITLLCGAVLGVCRLWLFLKRLRNEKGP
ncbi:hypothetical protein BMS3Bbin10_02932 [bacterium BMS3Bbin10]|nr:hypothetical protein BMS3Bbin10_02932 [bacterium BMS3Bbin10]